MYYQATITTPAATLASNSSINTLLLARGTINKMIVAFPPGAASLLHVQVNDKGWQLCPWSLGESLAWDGYVFEMLMSYDLIAEPYEVTIITWNEDDSYEHQVFVGVELTEGEPQAGVLLAQYPLAEGTS